MAELAARGLRGGGRRRRRGLRDHRLRQRDDDAARARDRPRAAVDGAVHRHRARAARGAAPPTSASACTRARRPSCSRRWAPTSAATSSPACSRPASRATGACGCSSTSAPTARSRSARAERVARHRGARPARRSRRRRSAAACAPPTARSRACRSTTTSSALQVIGDAEPVGHVRLGARRLRRRARALRPARPLRALHPRRGRRPSSRPGSPPRLTKIGEERVFVMHWRGEDPANVDLPLAARRPRAAVRQGVDRDRLAHPAAASSASSPATSSRCCWPGSFGAYLSAVERDPDRARAAAGAAADRLGRATSPARARRSPRCRCASAPRRARSCARSSTSSCRAARTSTTSFIDQLAFPG